MELAKGHLTFFPTFLVFPHNAYSLFGSFESHDAFDFFSSVFLTSLVLSFFLSLSVHSRLRYLICPYIFRLSKSDSSLHSPESVTARRRLPPRLHQLHLVKPRKKVAPPRAYLGPTRHRTLWEWSRRARALYTEKS